MAEHQKRLTVRCMARSELIKLEKSLELFKKQHNDLVKAQVLSLDGKGENRVQLFNHPLRSLFTQIRNGIAMRKILTARLKLPVCLFGD